MNQNACRWACASRTAELHVEPCPRAASRPVAPWSRHGGPAAAACRSIERVSLIRSISARWRRAASRRGTAAGHGGCRRLSRRRRPRAGRESDPEGHVRTLTALPLESGGCYDLCRVAGWSSQVARRAHNPEVAGSNPAPATGESPGNGAFVFLHEARRHARTALVQLADAERCRPRGGRPAIAAFTAGDVQRALTLTPTAAADALFIAGTPQDWIDEIEHDLRPAGFEHLLVTFADPFLVKRWAGLTVEGLPYLDDQIRLFERSVISELAETPDHRPAMRRTPSENRASSRCLLAGRCGLQLRSAGRKRALERGAYRRVAEIRGVGAKLAAREPLVCHACLECCNLGCCRDGEAVARAVGTIAGRALGKQVAAGVEGILPLGQAGRRDRTRRLVLRHTCGERRKRTGARRTRAGEGNR